MSWAWQPPSSARAGRSWSAGAHRSISQWRVYRIVQEGLRNAWQHADATEVTLRLGRNDQVLSLEITDNGRGFNRGDVRDHAGLGLASMEERARLLGGRMTVTSAPGTGTSIRATMPITTPHETTTDSVG